MPISQGRVTLGSTQPVRIGTAGARSFALKASEENVAPVYIGPSGVTTATGFPLEAGESVSVDGGGLEDLWAAGTSGDVLVYLAVA